MTARKSPVCMNKIDGICTLHLSKPAHSLGEQECARSRKAETAGEGEIPNPLCWYGETVALVPSTAIKRLCSEHSVAYAKLGSRKEGLVNKATGGIILVGRVKRSQRENMQLPRRARSRNRREIHKLVVHGFRDAAILR